MSEIPQDYDMEKFAADPKTVIGKAVWNAAIEAAANKVESNGAILLAHAVRELKK